MVILTITACFGNFFQSHLYHYLGFFQIFKRWISINIHGTHRARQTWPPAATKIQSSSTSLKPETFPNRPNPFPGDEMHLNYQVKEGFLPAPQRLGRIAPACGARQAIEPRAVTEETSHRPPSSKKRAKSVLDIRGVRGHCCIKPSRGDFGLGHKATRLARDPIFPVQVAATCAVG
jgi:hypothetical protein